MKITMLLVCASAMLAGCAATPSQPGQKNVAQEERYVPTGTLFTKKDPKRSDRTKVTSGEDLENLLRQSGDSAGGKM
ncbi:hypothetical protein [Massilia sp. DD77]|uniref:hypothetical protein n=1 Tax=Massilia sp. DD77 TaxID=3109349 RepID=UPI002FFF82F5